MNDALILKIKKILEKTEQAGCTEQEAQSAFAMASRLMAEHNIEMSDVESATYVGPQTYGPEEADLQFVNWKTEFMYASSVVQNHFFVKSWISTAFPNGNKRKTLYFFGTPENVSAAKFVFHGLLAAFDRLWVRYRAVTSCPITDKRCYIVGVARGFDAKLKEEREVLAAERDLLKPGSGTEIALRNASQELASQFEASLAGVKRKTYKCSPVTNGSRSSYEAGYSDGKKLELNRSIGGRQQTSKAIG